MPKCKECGWWELIKDEVVLAENNDKKRGRCHRRAPRPTPVVMPTLNALRQVVPQVLELTIWPITTPEMWCGDFKPNVLLEPDAKTQSLMDGSLKP